jgi:hypothetical protein
MNTRQTILVSLAILLVGAVAVWWYLGFTLDFMRFFAAEPGVTDTSASPSASPAGGVRVTCAPATQTVDVGASATLNAAEGSGTYTWFAPEGIAAVNNQSGSDTFGVAYQTPGIKKVTVQSPRGGNSTNVDSVACTVIVVEEGV